MAAGARGSGRIAPPRAPIAFPPVITSRLVSPACSAITRPYGLPRAPEARNGRFVQRFSREIYLAEGVCAHGCTEEVTDDHERAAELECDCVGRVRLHAARHQLTHSRRGR